MLGIIIIAGFVKSDTANLQPFILGGADNMLEAGALVFFALVGFDAAASAVEVRAALWARC